MQKLDLLNHLTANLAHTIVICGPEGIGKTKLLKLFQLNSAQSCMICWLQGEAKLDYTAVLDAIFTTVADYSPDLKTQPLATALDRIQNRGAKVILVVDDAGKLIPGLIEKIIGYSNVHPALRIVLALSHGELYLKNGTDPALEDCYLVEIPALTEQQCEDYLDYLSTLPQPRIDFNHINEAKVAQVFQETHGVPGKILKLLPVPTIKKNVDYSKPALLVAVMGLVLLALGVQWWTAHHPPVDENAAETGKSGQTVSVQAPQTAKPIVNLEQGQPGITSGQLAQNTSSGENLLAQPQGQGAAAGNVVPQQAATGSNPSGVPGQQNPAVPVSEGKAPESAADANVNLGQSAHPDASQTNVESGGNVGEGGHWLAAQPSVNYTLQLMAMSNEQVILEVLQRYPELGEDLRYIKTKTRRGRDRFILFYGSFSDPLLIKAEKQKLPKELQKIWVRQIADLQKELNATEPVQPKND